MQRFHFPCFLHNWMVADMFDKHYCSIITVDYNKNYLVAIDITNFAFPYSIIVRAIIVIVNHIIDSVIAFHYCPYPYYSFLSHHIPYFSLAYPFLDSYCFMSHIDSCFGSFLLHHPSYLFHTSRDSYQFDIDSSSSFAASSFITAIIKA